MGFPAQVRIVEVGPRDGLQNEPSEITILGRVALVNGLALAGLTVIEVGSFVSPRRVPRMAGTAAVLAAIDRPPGVSFPVLVPNLRGLEEAKDAVGVTDIAVFGSASETFSHRNIGCSVDASLDRFMPVVETARDLGWRVRGYVSCVLGCPYEGDVPVPAVARVASALYRMGCYEVSLGDTIGTGTPLKARRMVAGCLDAGVPAECLAAHFHDTYGQALANILAVLEDGVAVVDSSVAGLGGCPYAPGATGNVATEDVVYMLEGMGIYTGVDLVRLARVGRDICQCLGRLPDSRVSRALCRHPQDPETGLGTSSGQPWSVGMT